MIKKNNIPNLFSFIKILFKKEKHNYHHEIVVDVKNKNRIIKGNINFEDELSDLGFNCVKQNNNNKIFKYSLIPNIILIFNIKNKDVSIYYEKKLLSKINFIPNSSIFTEIWIKKTIENINK